MPVTSRDELGVLLESFNRMTRQLDEARQVVESNRTQLTELTQLQGKSREVTMKLWQKVNQEKEAYNAALTEYKIQRTSFNSKRNTLLDLFNPTKLDMLCSRSLQAMNDSWTTPGLTRGMRELIRLIQEDFKAVCLSGEDIRHLMEGVYNTFQQRFKFEKMDFPLLDFDGPRTQLQILISETEEFCKDPVNIVMTEKRYMVRRFWRMLVEQARRIFNEARADTDRWLTAVPLPLETQIRDHKAQLQARLDSLAKINERGGTMEEEVATLHKQRLALEGQVAMITQLIMQVRDVGPSEDAVVAPPAAVTQEMDFLKTQRIAAVVTEPNITVKLPTKETPPEFLTTQKLDLNAKT